MCAFAAPQPGNSNSRVQPDIANTEIATFIKQALVFLDSISNSRDIIHKWLNHGEHPKSQRGNISFDELNDQARRHNVERLYQDLVDNVGQLNELIVKQEPSLLNAGFENKLLSPFSLPRSIDSVDQQVLKLIKSFTDNVTSELFTVYKNLDADIYSIASAVKIETPWLVTQDLPAVLKIEENSFESPWSRQDFIRCLNEEHNYGIVAKVDNIVTGFMIYKLDKRSIHILNLAVHLDFRRHMIGKQMLDKLISKLSSNRPDGIICEVRESNLIAQCFFRDCGFKAISVLKDFYEDTTDDAYIMQFKASPDIYC